MNIQEISIKKLRSFYIPTNLVNKNVADRNLLIQLQGEAMRLGFIFKEEALTVLANSISDNYTSVFKVLSELVGADKVWKPFYSNFPNEVIEASDVELFWNAIIHYYSNGEFRLETPSTKVPTYEKVNFKEIGYVVDEDIQKLYVSILNSNGSITDFDRSVIVDALDRKDISFLSDKNLNIGFKETLCFLVGNMFERDIKVSNFKAIKTATDVLRIATHFSNGDITLAQKCRFSLSNRQRKYVVSLLENVIFEEEVARYKSEWIHLFHNLHIGSFKSAKRCNIIAKKLREDKVRSQASNLEMALVSMDKKTLLAELPKNMGDFARRLDHVLRSFEDLDFLKVFLENISRVDSRVLLQVLGHFKFRDENENSIRVVIPKGNTSKAHILPKNDYPIHSTIIGMIVSGVEAELRNRFKQKEDLGKVYISDDLKKAPVPMQMRTASDGLFVMQRGTRLPLNKDKSVLRFFIHWVGNDIDLSASFLTEDLNYHSCISYYNLKNGYSGDNPSYNACHSGDITSAPNGACEFIDIDLNSVDTTEIRYIAMDVRVYSGLDFVSQQTNAGWMMRDEVSSKKGEIFDAKTVEQRIAVSSNAKLGAVLVALFDIVNREVIWLDMEGSSNGMYGGNNVASNKASIRDIANMALNMKKISTYDLLKLHADSRGETTSEKENADTVFDSDYVFKYTEILSEYI